MLFLLNKTFNSLLYLLHSSSSNACTPKLSQTKALDALDSSESLETESGIQTRFSISTSLAMTSDLTSPEDPTVSFNPIMSKESSSSMIALANGETMQSVKLSTPSLNLTDSVNHIEQEASTCNQWYRRNLFYFLNSMLLYFMFMLNITFHNLLVLLLLNIDFYRYIHQG